MLMLVMSVACCLRIFSLFLALLDSSVPPPATLAELLALLVTRLPVSPGVLSLLEVTRDVRDRPRPGPDPPLSD